MEHGALMESASEAKIKQTFVEKLKERGFFRPYVLLTEALFLLSLLIYVFARCFEPFAEFWSRYPAQGIRFALAKLSGLVHFSVAEWVILSIPLLIAGYFFFSNRSMKHDESVGNYFRWLLPLVCGLLAILIIFMSAFGPCYFRKPLEDNLGLEKRKVSAEELYDTAVILAEELNRIKDEVTFGIGGASVMQYDYNTLVCKINDAYAKYAGSAEYISHFDSKAKPLAVSKFFTYTHISGVYTFMTGEVNINVNYPDFIRPFTIAHEFSHQRGIAREDEANFVAYLVCIGSEDAYVRYSGYANMLQYVTDALWAADQELYKKFANKYLPVEVKGEFGAYSLFFDQYRDSTVSEVTGAVNDAFLGSQGEKEGTASYGLVVDLAVAYYLHQE